MLRLSQICQKGAFSCWFLCLFETSSLINECFFGFWHKKMSQAYFIVFLPQTFKRIFKMISSGLFR